MPTDDIIDLFGGPLRPDPSMCLKPFAVPPLAVGPQHKVQFVIELVGPRTVPAESAKVCLDPRWQAALGHPEVFVMAAVDTAWRPLTSADAATAYDSLALAWDMVQPRGSLSRVSATNLLRTAEQLGEALSRRVMPLPPPSDVDDAVATLSSIAAGLDVGVGLTIVPRYGDIPEKTVWTTCAALGLQGDSGGLFEWRIPAWDEPILTLSSLGTTETFSLRAVMDGATHPGLSVGFRVPRSPDPPQALRACLAVADAFSTGVGAIVLDDDDRPVDVAQRQNLVAELDQAAGALRRVGLEPGSAAALKLFP